MKTDPTIERCLQDGTPSDKASKFNILEILEAHGRTEPSHSYFSRLTVEGLETYHDHVLFTDIAANTDLLRMSGEYENIKMNVCPHFDRSAPVSQLVMDLIA